MTRCKIVNCHQATIVKDPSDTELMNEVVDILERGTEINVDKSTIYWSWNDKQYYKCKWRFNEGEGYIRTSLVEEV